MTFSIVARCAETGMFGVAVSSSSPAVAARCAYARAGVGAVASQNITDPMLGPRALALMAGGEGADAAIADAKTVTHAEYRQVAAVDREGNAAIHSGAKTLGTWNEAIAANVACAGNLLSDRGVPAAMVDAFLAKTDHLAERMLGAMEAALKAGGEEGPVRSAGLLLVDRVAWPVADLRVDWSDECPIVDLRRIWEIYEPQLQDYVTRALDPAQSPRYGVPGDE